MVSRPVAGPVWSEEASVACMKLLTEDEGLDGQLQRGVGTADWYRAWMAGLAPVVFWTAAFDWLDSKKP